MTDKELLDLKRQVGEAKNKVAELKGQRTELMRQLKDDWGCSSIEQAQTKAAAMKKEIDELNIQIENDLKELETKYGK